MKKLTLLAFTVLAFCFPSVSRAADGTPLWTNATTSFIGQVPTTLAAPHAIALGSGGNAFVCGYILGSQSNLDFQTVKYSPDGTMSYARSLNGPANGIDAINAVAVDTNGNFYVTGKSVGVGSGYDFATVKYSNNGTLQGQHRYAGTNDDIANAITSDLNGEFFVTGQSYTSSTGSVWVTIKYGNDISGTPVWTNTVSGAATGLDQPKAIATDASGNVYVTGYSTRIDGDFDYVTAKYSNAGSLQWIKSYNGTFAGDDMAQSLAVDANNNVYVTGISTGTGGSFDYVTIKYSSTGSGVWTNVFNGAGDTDDEAVAVAIDPDANVYVTGTSIGAGGSFGYVTIKYSNTGTPAWTNFFNGVGNRGGQASALAVDASGSAFVTGTSYGGLRADEFVTIKYSTAGTALWTNFLSGGTANAMALDTNGNVYVVGGDGNFTVVKYASVLGSPELTFVTTNGNFGPVNNQFVMSLIGPAGSNTVVSGSTNLQDWSPIATNPLPIGTLQVTDTLATNYLRRFYRAQLK
jgi:hypothetical protein